MLWTVLFTAGEKHILMLDKKITFLHREPPNGVSYEVGEKYAEIKENHQCMFCFV